MKNLEAHRTIAAALHIGFGVIGVLLAMVTFVAVAGGGLISGDAFVIALTGTVATTVAVIVLVFSLPGLIGGIAVMRGASWGRPLLLVAAAMSVIFIPLGTIIGVYTLIVLTSEETQSREIVNA